MGRGRSISIWIPHREAEQWGTDMLSLRDRGTNMGISRTSGRMMEGEDKTTLFLRRT